MKIVEALLGPTFPAQPKTSESDLTVQFGSSTSVADQEVIKLLKCRSTGEAECLGKYLKVKEESESL